MQMCNALSTARRRSAGYRIRPPGPLPQGAPRRVSPSGFAPAPLLLYPAMRPASSTRSPRTDARRHGPKRRGCWSWSRRQRSARSLASARVPAARRSGPDEPAFAPPHESRFFVVEPFLKGERPMIATLLLTLLAQSGPHLPWKAWGPLLGEWVADAEPDGGTGGFTLDPSVEGRVLVRKNRADYPASKDRPAAHHEDLMVVFHEGGATRADYFDNEGHVIHYKVTIGDGKAEFVSDKIA